MVDLGYAAIMETGTDAARALLESMPNRSSMSREAAALELENIRVSVTLPSSPAHYNCLFGYSTPGSRVLRGLRKI